jgi:hypothetical protein
MKLSLLNSLALVIMALVTRSHVVYGTELVCVLGGKLACEINCLTSTGQFTGDCNKDNDCICEPDETEKPPVTPERRSYMDV